jgi:uncharacterized RDD family membrane protein YckC
MNRRLAVYHGHESARMAELEGAPLASFAVRAVAFFIDMAIAGLSFVLPLMAGATIAIKMGWIHNDVHIKFDPFHHEEWPSLAWFVIFIAASNYIGNGATIGKELMKIRVVSLVHHRLSLWHSMERALGYGASALEAFFGFFQYFVDPNHQTVHDRIARTIVVSERKRRIAEAAAEIAAAGRQPSEAAPSEPAAAEPALPAPEA